ncbi:restriction endonuclease subunit S [Neiella marina]|uniref:Restriction endonuclease subunit S n=1 Tax=Neiella holothuriorum TaxID=2870530 RepID=A0ABS7EFR6_9GAMM|nr:restriction endonuclease subunit S [Neiella holothuriorum]MBW8191193.1 restriction endonuclease subunit S [Neiella holothuriorum]
MSNQVAEVSAKYLVEAAEKAVPVGYKQTEVGVIPEDWDVATIEELAGIIDPQPDHRTPPESSNGEPYIGISDFINSKEVDWTASRKIISKAVDKQEKSFQLQKGDIVFGKIGTIGVPKFVPQVPFRFALSANVILLQPKNIEPVYLMEFFYSELFQKTLKSELHSTSQAAFGMNKMRLIELPLPPKEEQTAIANALSDVDALIRELEKLIAKKQAIKTATMQQLLTGRTRLPQFALREDGMPKGTKPSELGEIPDDWEVHALGSLCGYQNGKAQEQYFNSNDGYKVISIGNYSESGRYIETGSYIDKQFKNEIGRFVLSCDDLTMILNDKTAVGTIIGRVLLIEADDTYVMNQRTMRLTPKEGVQSKFLHFLINSDSVHKRIVGMAKPGTQIYVNTDDVLEFNLIVPNSQYEQTAIATILSDMDAEIQALEQRLGKTRQIKQGMMQELLTGKTRLIKSSKEVIHE